MMTVKEVALLKGVSPQAVRLAIWTGRLTALKYGRDWMVTNLAANDWRPRGREQLSGEAA